LGRYAEALELQLEVLRQVDEAGESDGYVHEELAECLLALGRADEAREHFYRAETLLAEDTWFVETEGPRLQRLKVLARMGDQ
jgi:hypothetical protein